VDALVRNGAVAQEGVVGGGADAETATVAVALLPGSAAAVARTW
jgi:hypothetical protein